MGNLISFTANLTYGDAYYLAIKAYSETETSTFSNIEYFVLDHSHLSFSSEAGSFNGEYNLDILWT